MNMNMNIKTEINNRLSAEKENNLNCKIVKVSTYDSPSNSRLSLVLCI